MLMYIHTFKHIYYNYIGTKFLTLSMKNYSAYIHIGVSGLNSNTTNTTIIITWNPAISPDCGPVLSYTVSATNLVDGSVRNPGRLSQRVAEFSNLIDGTNYNISVAAVNRAGTGPSSTIIVTGNAIGTYCKITFSICV